MEGSFRSGSNYWDICHAMMRYAATCPQCMELELPPSSFVIFSTPGCILCGNVPYCSS